MLDEKKLMAIELMSMGELKISEIADKVGVSFKTLYNWQQNKEFSSNLQERTFQFQTLMGLEGRQRLCAKGQLALDNVFRLANTSDSDKIRLEANTYILDHVFGKATTKVDITAKQVEVKETTVDLDSLMLDIPEVEETE